ncbi:hypothetical protein [Sphingomonas nostoxanthinifaciens]|uniref:hypothetical protein n=1 Tax=Sphingomonas nostoxanthinifaciens TaxID=2872652 RepID=UPI001CC20981|nr:hypothetical protein [Sphingomonas nostoxanthinifaciens]UAK25698.1 hypothetical protein K8P63_06055 [Sphingomonas nostoxanthinifaciens]
MVETIVGTLMVCGATGWAQVRAFLSHTRLAAAWAALNAEPASLPVAAAGQACSAGPVARP